MMIRLLIMMSAITFACSNDASVHDASSVPLDGLSCVPTGTCATGAVCGTTCCGHGESCVDGTCMCGIRPSCTGGNVCASPVAKPDLCGSLCCGVTSECPGVAETPL